jgi:hypothetical protein
MAGHQFDQLMIGNLFSSNLIAYPINIIDIVPLLPAAIFFVQLAQEACCSSSIS